MIDKIKLALNKNNASDNFTCLTVEQDNKKAVLSFDNGEFKVECVNENCFWAWMMYATYLLDASTFKNDICDKNENNLFFFWKSCPDSDVSDSVCFTQKGKQIVYPSGKNIFLCRGLLASPNLDCNSMIQQVCRFIFIYVLLKFNRLQNKYRKLIMSYLKQILKKNADVNEHAWAFAKKLAGSFKFPGKYNQMLHDIRCFQHSHVKVIVRDKPIPNIRPVLNGWIEVICEYFNLNLEVIRSKKFVTLKLGFKNNPHMVTDFQNIKDNKGHTEFCVYDFESKDERKLLFMLSEKSCFSHLGCLPLSEHSEKLNYSVENENVILFLLQTARKQSENQIKTAFPIYTCHSRYL